MPTNRPWPVLLHAIARTQNATAITAIRRHEITSQRSTPS
jgi:hypothetical protein